MPGAISSERDAVTVPLARPAGARADGPPDDYRVLLVEDSPADATLVVAMLTVSQPRPHVTVVGTLGAAIEALAMAGFSAVIADLGLPDAAGLDVVSAVHAHAPGVPLVVLTGTDDEETAVAAVSLGAQDYLVKSRLDARTLMTSLHYAVERAAAAVRERRYEQLARTLLDAMDSPTCAVDAAGRITVVNAAWDQLAAATHTRAESVGIGVDYLRVCDEATGDDASVAHAVAAGLRRVLSGAVPRFEVEYACANPTELRWYSLRVNALPERSGAVLAHVDITDLVRAREVIRHQAWHDQLTGLPNRQLLFDRLAQALERQPRHGGHVTLLFCDLDGFKEVNDSYGHAAGDDVLRVVAARIREAVRPEDTVARLGGDEFVVICEGVVGLDAEHIASRVHHALERRPVLTRDGVAVGMSASIGIASAPPMSDPELLLATADAAMYDAKSRGSAGTCTFATPAP